MKAIIITVAAFLTAAVSANAQTDPTPKVYANDGFHMGVRVGGNMSNLIRTGTDDATYDAKFGFNGALFFEIPVASFFQIQPEVQFSQKGYKTTGTALGTPYEYKVTSNFIEIPLLVKFKPSENFGILVGPQFSFLASTHTKFMVNNTSVQKAVDEDNSNLRKNVLGGVIGLEASSGPVVFNARYNLDFHNNNGDGSSTIPDYKNQVFSLGIGYRF